MPTTRPGPGWGTEHFGKMGWGSESRIIFRPEPRASVLSTRLKSEKRALTESELQWMLTPSSIERSRRRASKQTPETSPDDGRVAHALEDGEGAEVARRLFSDDSDAHLAANEEAYNEAVRRADRDNRRRREFERQQAQRMGARRSSLVKASSEAILPSRSRLGPNLQQGAGKPGGAPVAGHQPGSRVVQKSVSACSLPPIPMGGLTAIRPAARAAPSHAKRVPALNRASG